MFKPKVIVPPASVATAAEAKAVGVFDASEDNTYIDTMIAIAQSQIDGWNAWLGRAVGVQTLEIDVPGSWEFDESCLLGDFLEEVSDTEQSDGTRKYRYTAGFQTVPPAIKHAVILMAAALADAAPSEGGEVRRETVEGVGSIDYQVGATAAVEMSDAAKYLLQPFKVYRV